jgi:hypothetical protein
MSCSPFAIEGPAVISFSGGRTSGLMLRRCLDEGLGADVHVLFANTGKEREETLDFVHDVETRWSVPIVWLERLPSAGFHVVTYETAARRGEPFEELIAERKFLPNPVARYCTTELKIRPMRDYMRARGYDYWTNVVGLRADEPHRVSRQRAGIEAKKERWDVEHPLHAAGLTVEDVRAFWRGQTFDLRLEPWEGNCDLCYLKGRAKKERIIRDTPDAADWWIEQERRIGQPFRRDQPSYSQLVQIARRPMLPFTAEDLDSMDDLGDCICLEAA